MYYGDRKYLENAHDIAQHELSLKLYTMILNNSPKCVHSANWYNTLYTWYIKYNRFLSTYNMGLFIIFRYSFPRIITATRDRRLIVMTTPLFQAYCALSFISFVTTRAQRIPRNVSARARHVLRSQQQKKITST